MTEEIKRILDYLINEKAYLHYGIRREKFIELEGKEVKTLLDYITNLQQDLDKAIDTIGKDRQFYKCRMDEYVDYKSRFEKANDFIDNYDVFKEFSFPLMKRDIENQIKSSIDYEFNSTFRKKLKNILNGSDEK